VKICGTILRNSNLSTGLHNTGFMKKVRHLLTTRSIPYKIMSECSLIINRDLMNKNLIIEVATYVVVGSAIWIISPLLGKFLDSLYFLYPNLFSDSIAFVLAGIFLITLGMILVAWTITLFKTGGKGTPNPKLPPKNFIVNGPYQVSRNPMALGGLLILLGESAIYYSPSLLGLSIIYGVVVYLNAKNNEEPELIKRFGEPYVEYLKKVPRFFPNLSNILNRLNKLN
jgi:protein-S-isoprenylcysteine O-methyltransferase Ste14